MYKTLFLLSPGIRARKNQTLAVYFVAPNLESLVLFAQWPQFVEHTVLSSVVPQCLL